MGAAKEELRSAVDAIDEGQAELLLSFLHLLRARGSERETVSRAADAPAPHPSPLEALLLASLLERAERSPEELRAILRGFSASEDLAWLSLTEESLGRDWNRPEEDEAWADL